jgi:phosphoglucosamine mutase
MRKYFGTDGIRGRANEGFMTAEMAMKVAAAAGQEMARAQHRSRVVVAKDTRLSGYMIEAAMQAGFVSVGMDVMLLGPVPTPAVGMLTRSLRADLGVMISASHNSFEDNGIKLFGADGFKLSDETELAIEARIDAQRQQSRAGPEQLGRARRIDDAAARYIEAVKSSFPRHLGLEGLRIVVDCAHGAAYKVAPTVLWELGAELVVLGDEPNGMNINKDRGSTHLDAVRAKVVETRADLGLALDGDADRVILIDEKGRVVDGDQLMAVIAKDWSRRGLLATPHVVATVMSNLGLERCLAAEGITLLRTKVGDRYVVEAMRAGGHNLGGEQSGHLVMTDYATTGDGLLASLQLLACLRAQDQPMSQLTRMFEPVPQLLRNVRYQGGDPLAAPHVQEMLQQTEQSLGEQGRLVVRKSGTEPLIRVMLEGDDASLINDLANKLCKIIEEVSTE